MKAFFRTKHHDLLFWAEKIIIYLLVGLALVGMVGPLLIHKYNWSLLGSYLGVPMILAPLTWTKVKNNRPQILLIRFNVQYFFATIYFACWAVSVLVLDLYPLRNTGYYLLIAVMGMCILCQILLSGNLSRNARNAVLLETGLLMLNIVWGVTLKYYYFIGRTDMLHHSWLAENLMASGHIGPVFEHYEAFPLWHILCTGIIKICGLSLPPHQVMFIVNGLVYFFLVLLVYLAVVKLLNNHQIALLSALFTCLNPDVLFYGMYSIPRSVVFFLEVLLIYLLLQRKNTVSITLTIFVSLAIVMYHTASMPFVIVILLVIYSLQRIFRVDKTKYFVNFNYLLLVVVLTVAYWYYFGEKVFASLAKSLFLPAAVGPLTASVINTPLNELFNYLQYSPLLFFVICGVLWVLPSAQSNMQGKLFFVSALGLTFVTLPGPTLLINKLAGNFNLGRFGEYSFFFICMAGATGLYALYAKARTQQRPAVILLFAIMAFLSVSNDFSASDNPLIKRPFYTFYFTENETTAINRLSGFTEGYVMADAPAHKFLECTTFANKAHILEVSAQEPRFLINSHKDLILIRKGELAKRPLKLFTSQSGAFTFDPSLEPYLEYYFKDSPLWITLGEYNKVYDSGTVFAYNPQLGGAGDDLEAGQ